MNYNWCKGPQTPNPLQPPGGPTVSIPLLQGSLTRLHPDGSKVLPLQWGEVIVVGARGRVVVWIGGMIDCITLSPWPHHGYRDDERLVLTFYYLLFNIYYIKYIIFTIYNILLFTINYLLYYLLLTIYFFVKHIGKYEIHTCGIQMKSIQWKLTDVDKD